MIIRIIKITVNTDERRGAEPGRARGARRPTSNTINTIILTTTTTTTTTTTATTTIINTSSSTRLVVGAGAAPDALFVYLSSP